MRLLVTAAVAAIALGGVGQALAQATATDAPAAAASDAAADAMPTDVFGGLKLRNIGPAFMSGRIADIEIMQHDPDTWIVGVASGGVWRTDNAGVTWKPIFDDQGSYSIGEVAIDPSNPNVIWVGTGENNGGRHLGFGDGVYRSKDGGETWENLGLKTSEHISKIIVHPDNPDVAWVAAQGPLWSPGRERGLYKTTDGGKTWKNVLSKGEWTGVTDLMIDPRDPDRLYAATWQHHRNVAAYMGGGPETGLFASTDGGETWTELTEGLPEENMGKIGLAMSPQNPDVLYAAIELERRTGGIWRSADRGASWTKMSDAVGGGTGPHYYQELFASPHQFDKIYMVSNTTMVSSDGGKTMVPLNNEYKHVDDHAIAFHPTNPDYILFGSDGGVYESRDGEKTWRYINNLPVTQFYKVAVDDAEPFYFVYGGTQDNSSQGGPSRTDNRHGIRNSDWFLTLFADGHQSATEPGNPDIMYAEWQEGNLVRHDRTTGENVHIQPQPKPGEPLERYNWDAPIYVSRHDPKRIYFASQRLWRSDDRGDSWTAVSGDLTRNQDRMQLPIMGRKWSWDAGWDFLAMSMYNTITSVGESPVDENVLYVGTDDGLIQATKDGGATWRKVPVGSLPGVPDTAFVNDIRADLHDRDTVYVALDNHKYGDYTPYLYRSTDGGTTWESMVGDLPERHLVWRIVQDHVDKDLFFLATEFGLYFSVDAGGQWVKLPGAPTISFRDVTIQRRENDVVAASFGRGFYVLDDLAPLRSVDAEALEKEAHLFPGRKAWWYFERHPLSYDEGGEQGHSYYRAPNPPFGATFTYFLKEGLKTTEEIRQEAEKKKIEAGEDTPFPGYDAIEKERREEEPKVILTVRNAAGEVVRRIEGPVEKGFHRVTWDLRYPPMEAIAAPVEGEDAPEGFLAAPGDYTVSLAKRVRGKTTELVGPQAFKVERLRTGALPGAPINEVVAFWERVAKLDRAVGASNQSIEALEAKLAGLKTAIGYTRTAPSDLDTEWSRLRNELDNIVEKLSGNQSKAVVGQEPEPNITQRLGKVGIGVGLSAYGPTKTHRQVLGYAEQDFAVVRERLVKLKDEAVPALEAAIIEAGGPVVGAGPIPAAGPVRQE
ncbi:MAG: glycosyl hydrolase [Alphaproteobacteria bacterium]|nr:glycosyl hydrolase [Alphaproteobacteria bacterium]